MKSFITHPNDFSPTDVVFSDVKTNNYGGKIVYINRESCKFRVQTPEMSMPYGLSENEILDPKTNEVIGHKYNINLSFKGMKNDSSDNESLRKEALKLRKFHDMMSSIDNLVIEKAMDNSISWLKMKKANRDTVTALYSPIIIKSKDKETQEPNGKYPDTIKGKLPFYNSAFSTEVYNEHKEQIDVKSSLIKGTTGKTLLECTGIWFAGGRFGVGWKVVQMKVKVPETLKGYAFIESSDDDDDE